MSWRHSLYARIALVFALALLGFGAWVAWLGYSGARAQQSEVVQRISGGLAAHIAAHETLIEPDGRFDADTVKALFDTLMAVNPSIEAYLLDPEGRIVAAGDGGPLQRQQVALKPLQALLSGAGLPVYGDNPRNAGRGEVFTAAPVFADGRLAGYLYIVLLGDMYRAQIDALLVEGQLRTMMGLGAVALGLTLLAGLLLFGLITRPLDRLGGRVAAFMATLDEDATQQAAAGDEIARLDAHFRALQARIEQQFDALRAQDELRRSLVANISHDLRTPLTAMQNYLETLQRLGDSLGPERRREYLDIATRHSRRVARLSQQLFELAQLECEDAPPSPEPFSAAELACDVAQKFALEGERRGITVDARVDASLPAVVADVGMIERVLTNLVENALRFTPRDGRVTIAARPRGGAVELSVADTGDGIAAEHLPSLFDREAPLRRYADGEHGGLGLLICARIVAMHGADLQVDSAPGEGTRFGFTLAAAPDRRSVAA